MSRYNAYKQGTKQSYSLIDSCKRYPAQDECHCVGAYGEPYEMCPDCEGTGKMKRQLTLYEKGIKKGNRGFLGYEMNVTKGSDTQDWIDNDMNQMLNIGLKVER